MFTKLTKICILMFVIAPVFAFGGNNSSSNNNNNSNGDDDAANVNVKNLQTITATTTTTPTTDATAPVKTETITTTLAYSTITNDLEVISATATTTTPKDAADRRIELEREEYNATTMTLTIKPEMEAVTSKTTTAAATAAGVAAVTTTTSTATPTTTATTSTTTTTTAPTLQAKELKGLFEKEEAEAVAKEIEEKEKWLTHKNGNESGAQISRNEKLQKKKKKQQKKLYDVIAATAATASSQATPKAARQTTTTTITTKLIMPEASATETLVMAHTTPAAGDASIEFENENVATKKLVTTDFDILATADTIPTTSATTLEALIEPDPELPTINAVLQIASKVYQVPETNEDNDNDDVDVNAENMSYGMIAERQVPSKLNIVDLYPMKVEDFEQIQRDSTEGLLQERTIFKQPLDAAEYRQNLMPNEVEYMAAAAPEAAAAVTTAAATKSLNRDAIMPTATGETLSDFTGKLLAEQDGIITEIEQKFLHLHEFHENGNANGATVTTTTTSEQQTKTATMPQAKVTTATPAAVATTKPKQQQQQQHTFIDRRVKKSFDFPIHRAASDVMSMPHIDFANTKFNTDTQSNIGNISGVGAGTATGAAAGAPVAAHPEFSTTKFYNSEELYKDYMRKLMKGAARTTVRTTTHGHTTTTETATKTKTATLMKSNKTTTMPTMATSGVISTFGKLKSSTHVVAADSESDSDSNSDHRKLATSTTETSTTAAARTTADSRRLSITPTTPAAETFSSSSSTTAMPILATTTMTTTLKPKKYQKEFKRAKLLLKAMLPTSATATATTTTKTFNSAATLTKPTSRPTKSVTAAMATAATAAASAESSTTNVNLENTSFATIAGTETSLSQQHQQQQNQQLLSSNSLTQQQQQQQQSHSMLLNPPKSALKPIARPRILSRLQEKINSLECEIQNVPQDSHLWRGNETHELLLPIVTTEHCRNLEQHADCTPNVVSWEGEAEIQSGDILIVEINDAMLNPNEQNNTTGSAHAAQVYQVTRSGHEHCDVTEGILLDITPLVVDGRKLVTLYDKDLTEGVNLLIVVSDLWGSQCVRLKVTTKTDNCGENADCSGKGVCYSNPAMEEYECQCCSGFAGPHCEEIDACNPSPCTNNGICVDLSQGHEGNSYQCLCPYGYTGKNCQYESDPCNPAECMNGGSCVGNSTHFRCDCTPGYTGPLCQHSLNECESSPCVHGICVDQEDGFRCFCQPGFAGELCNFEYNECESNPCQNGGECIDHIGSYECRCTKGYTGNRCQIKVDFCANKPCPEGQRCIDHGNDFSCECPGGRNGPDCNQMPRTQCNVNPCTHGGTCWSSGDSFYCACRPGYTGTMCEDEFVVETVVSSSEFIVDDTSARNFNDKTFGSSVVLKSPIELHNAYFAAGVLAAAIFIVAVVVTICHCKVNQTYRKFSTRSTTFFPILGFSRRPKLQNKLNKHWLSGKGLGGGGGAAGAGATCAAGVGVGTGGVGIGSNANGNLLRSNANASLTATTTTTTTTATSSSNTSSATRHLPQPNGTQTVAVGGRQLHERPFQRHLAMNLENDMYYTVDFSENSQHSPLIQ